MSAQVTIPVMQHGPGLPFEFQAVSATALQTCPEHLNSDSANGLMMTGLGNTMVVSHSSGIRTEALFCMGVDVEMNP